MNGRKIFRNYQAVVNNIFYIDNFTINSNFIHLKKEGKSNIFFSWS